MLGIMAGMVSCDLLYLTVTCSEFARGVQDCGLFWKLTSGWIPYSALLGWTVDTCVRQVTEALWFRLQKTAEFPQLQFMIVDIPVEVPRPFPMVLTVQQTIETLQVAPQHVVYFLVVAQRGLPVVFQTIETPQLPLDTVVDVLLCRSSKFLLCRRGGDSRLQCDDRFMRHEACSRCW